MKKFTKLFLSLALLLAGVGEANAEAKTYWEPSSAFGAGWNAETNTMSWGKNDNGWYILYTGFTPAVQNNSTEIDLLDKYTKMHINITSITGGDKLLLKIKSTGKDEKTIELSTGETDVVFANYADVDFSKVLEITLWGTLTGENENGTAEIDECYLLTNNRWEYQKQQQTVYARALGEALDLSSVVTNNTMVSIASTDGDILFGAYDIANGTGNQIWRSSFDDAFAKIDAAEVGKATYRYKITEATTTTDPGLVLPDGVAHVYCIQACDGNGNLYRGPYWQDGYLDDLGQYYCTSVSKGDNGGAFFAFTPVTGKDNTYKISSYKLDGTLQTENFQSKSEYILNVIGETPQQVEVDVLVEVFVPDTEDPGVRAVPDGWVSLIENGKLDGNNVTNFWTKNEDSGAIAAVRVADVGRNGGPGIKVTTKDNAGSDWGTQFFIKSSEKLKEGQKLHIEFDYRADRPQNAATQVHRAPGDYNANIDAVDFTVNWKHYSNDITITAGMCKQDNNAGDSYLQSFGLNLSHIRSTSNFYFDNIVLWTEDDPLKPQKTALQNAIAMGQAQNSFAKTEDSFATLTSAIGAGQTALDATDATAESLTAATTAITNAVAGLKLKAGYTVMTKDMFKTWTGHDAAEGTVNTGCAYNLNTSTDMPFGLSTVNWLNYANLSEYSTLSVIASAGAPRFCFNRIVDGGQDDDNEDNSKMIDIPNRNWGTTAYRTVEGNVHTIDLAKMTSDKGFADLHCIKCANYVNVTVSDMLLYRTLTVSAAGMASFGSSDKTADLSGATAVYAAKYENGYVKLTAVESKKVPAGVGVLVEGSGEIVPTFDVEADPVTSDLKVSNGTVSGNDIYVLAKKDDVLGFYKLAAENKVPAGKAYLQIAATSREFIPIDGEATAIKNVETAKANGTIYNLAGQQVKNAQKGVFIIDGKKVIK